MAEVASAYVSLIPSFKGGTSAIEKELSGAGSRGGSSASKSFKGSFLPGLKGLAAPVAGLIGLSTAIDFFKDANAEARESQKVGALTTRVIKSTGGAAKVTAKHVGALATAISKKTGIDDETIQSGQNMLLTFKNVRNETGKGNKIFDKATQTLVDLSSAMGTEPKQAAIQLGKALNDPVKGISALTRVGVTFDKEQQKQIKGLVAHGKTMQAQKIILHELNSEFGGAAAAQATAGDKLNVAWKNFEEQVGTALLPTLDKLSGWMTDKAIPAASKFIRQMQNGKGVGGQWGHAIKTAVSDVKTAFDKVEPVVSSVVKAFLKLPKWAQTGTAIGVGAGILGKKMGVFGGLKSLLGSRGKGGLGGGSGILGLVSKAKPVPVIVMNKGFDIPGEGGPGGGGPGKSGGVLGKAGALALTASPYVLPLLTKGDTAPGQDVAGLTPKQIAAHHSMTAAIGGLYKSLGADQFGFKGGKSADEVLANLLDNKSVRGLQVLATAAQTAGVKWNKFATDAMPKTQGAVKVLIQRLGSLPKQVATKVLTPGAIDSWAQVHKLKDQFDLTPKQVQTLVKLLGGDKALYTANELKNIYADIPRYVRTQAITDHIDRFDRQTSPTGPGHNATGTSFWRGGPSWVGENGPEVLDLPRGSRVIPNSRIDASVGGHRNAAGMPSRLRLVVGGREFDAYVDDRAGAVHASRDGYRRTTGSR